MNWSQLAKLMGEVLMEKNMVWVENKSFLLKNLEGKLLKCAPATVSSFQFPCSMLDF